MSYTYKMILDTSKMLEKGEYGVHETKPNNFKMSVPTDLIKMWALKHKDKVKVLISNDALVILKVDE